MKMISAIIRPDSLDGLVEVLHDEELIQGMTVTEVRGFGRQRGGKTIDEASAKIKFLPKTRVDIVVNDWDVPHVLEVMQSVLNTGKAGDGKIFVLDAQETLRIRTGEYGVKAV
jgi:nitrogen regulatory protein PII